MKAEKLALRVDLSGRVALVTGSSRGLGAATAKHLARCGADVIVTFRKREEDAEQVAADITALGCRAWTRQLELGEEKSIVELFGWIEREVGTLDLLVANAAATSFRPLLESERHHVERTFAISVTGFLKMVQLALPLMQKLGAGRIVAISGADTVTWIPAHGLLGAAKAALESLVQYLAMELGPRGVTIVGIRPGWIDGESIQKMLGPYYDQAIRLERSTHPLRASATPEDIAEAVALACTDAARWLSGTTLAADAGGLFAYCGRFATVAAMLPKEAVDVLSGAASSGSQRTTLGDAPSVPKP